MEKKYTTLLFDADNTLLDFSKSERLSLIKTLEHFGAPVTEEILNTYVALNNSLWKQLEKGEITKPELKKVRFKRFFDSIGFDFQQDTLQVNDYYLSQLSSCGYTIEYAHELCKTLSEQGFEIYIITNGIAKTQAQRFTQSGLLPYIKDIFVSEVIGYPKPDKRFFDYVLAHIPEKDKNKLLVIGDSLSSDIKGAMNSNLKSVWFNPSAADMPKEFTTEYTIKNLEEIIGLICG